MSQYELTLTRLLDAPADELFRCWTTPELMKQWFAPKPYTTPVAETDLRPGGASRVVMQSPEGQEIPCPGQYLEVIPGRKLVFTDAFVGDWVPSGNAPFMVATSTGPAVEFSQEYLMAVTSSGSLRGTTPSSPTSTRPACTGARSTAKVSNGNADSR